MARVRHTYDVDGLLQIASEVVLPELACFRSAMAGPPDLVIERALVGGSWPRLRTDVVADPDGILWREHLGALGANFRIQFDSPVRVQVGPLLALSPHVVYTNLVEPLVRFLLVSGGRMLLHAAVVRLNGRTVMLSARTDTGKTSTILSLLAAHRGVFFSDDMVVLDASGALKPYPKPLTISAHTVRAMPRHRLGLRSRLTLPVQSRLHSRAGRATGKRLSEMNLPIMAMNAAVQAVVPPPKYRVTDLVPCRIGTRTAMDVIFLIERGPHDRLESVPPAEALEELIRNTDDAYGFPPYGRLAPHIRLEGRCHEELVRRERAILECALGDRPVTRIVTAGYGWAEMIEEIAGFHAAEPVAAAS
jgi:dolichol-phosphate mannosyltransferase